MQSNTKNEFRGIQAHSQRSAVQKTSANVDDPEFMAKLETLAIEDIVEIKISRFFDQLGGFYPDGVYDLMLAKLEKPLLSQILKRVGGNQVHASRILGINRNTLRKKMKIYGLC